MSSNKIRQQNKATYFLKKKNNQATSGPTEPRAKKPRTLSNNYEKNNYDEEHIHVPTGGSTEESLYFNDEDNHADHNDYELHDNSSNSSGDNSSCDSEDDGGIKLAPDDIEELGTEYQVPEDYYSEFTAHVKRQLYLKYQRPSETQLSHHGTPLYPGCRADQTAEELHDRLFNIVCTNHLQLSVEKQFLSLLEFALPVGSNVPRRIERRKSVFKNQFGHQSVFQFHCCPNGHVVYAGPHYLLERCPVCNSERYTNADTTRTAHKEVSYKSLCLLICELLETQSFISALNYEFVDITDNQGISDGFYHGDIPKQYKRQMHDNFLLHKSKQSSTRVANDIIEVSLLFLVYYDGVQLYKNQSTDFWPLLISIVNLPPSLRVSYAIGLFTLSILSMKPGCTAERFILELFIQELEILCEGFEVCINGQTYFVQGRLISHIYDTKALESVLKVQATNAYAGCPLCGLIPGWGKNEFKSVSLEGHRRLLPWNHFCRYYGQTLLCCEMHWYTSSAVVGAAKPLLRTDNQQCTVHCALGRKKSELFTNSLCDQENKERIVSFLSNRRDDYTPVVWFNEVYSCLSFRNFLYYRSLDYRPFRKYLRVKDEVYRRNGNEAIVTKDPVRGVKGVWYFAKLPYMKIEDNVNWDPFHTLYNCAKYTLSLMFGDRTINQSTISFCEKYLMFPHLWEYKMSKEQLEEAKTLFAANNQKNKKGKKTKFSQAQAHPWCVTLSGPSKIHLCEYLEAIMFPSKMKTDYQFTKLASSFHKLKGVDTLNGIQKIHAIECGMDYITYLLRSLDKNIESSYLQLYRMMSSLYSSLLAPIFLPEEIELLYNKTVEFVSLRSGMFPPSESHLVFHQLIDIISHIKKHGPLKCFWSLPAERSMSNIKDCVEVGGKSVDKTAQERVYTGELSKFREHYSNNSNSFKSLEKTGLSYSFDPSTTSQIPKFDEFGFKFIPDRYNARKIGFSPHRKVLYVNFLVQETIRLLGPNGKHEELINRSSLYRLFTYFCTHRKEYAIVKRAGDTVKDAAVCTSDELYYWLERKDALFGDLKNNIIVMHSDQLSTAVNINLQSEQFDLLCAGHRVLSSDLVQIPLWLNYLDEMIDSYKSAVIWGKSFRGRGEDYVEGDLPERSKSVGSSKSIYCPNNQKNRLSENLCKVESAQFMSCWCKVHHYANQKLQLFPGANSTSARKFEIAQINYFFIVRLPTSLAYEPVNNLPIASITSRRVKLVTQPVNSGDHNEAFPLENLWQVDVDDSKSLDFETSFTGVFNIYSTPLAGVIVDTTGLPCDSNQPTEAKNIMFFALARNRGSLHDDEKMLKIIHPYHNIRALDRMKNIDIL